MARTNGIECTNYSKGGLSTRTWLTSSYGLTKLLSDEAKNLYWLALGINDYYGLGDDYLGTIDDIKDDYNDNPDTFYGNYGKIIAQIKNHAPNAKLIIITTPWVDKTRAMTTTQKNYNTAIKEIAEKFEICFIDQNDDNFIGSDLYAKYFVWGHPQAISYAGMAKALERLFNKAVTNYVDYFMSYVGN